MYTLPFIIVLYAGYLLLLHEGGGEQACVRIQVVERWLLLVPLLFTL